MNLAKRSHEFRFCGMSKKIVLLIAISVFAFTSAFAQSKKSKVEFLELWVGYNVKSTGLAAKMTIDIGQNKDHSLYDIVSNGEADNIIFKENGINNVFNSEVDVLTHLYELGWEILNIENINLLNKENIRYLLTKKL
jgi:hypothetical protein